MDTVKVNTEDSSSEGSSRPTSSCSHRPDEGFGDECNFIHNPPVQQPSLSKVKPSVYIPPLENTIFGWALGLRPEAVNNNEEEDTSGGEDEEEDEGVLPHWDEISDTDLEDFGAPPLSWDRLRLPIPYRYQPHHVKGALGPGSPSALQSLSFPTFVSPFESVEGSKGLVDEVWRKKMTSKSSALIPALGDLKNSLRVPKLITPHEYVRCVIHLLGGSASEAFSVDSKTNCLVKDPCVLISGISPSALLHYSEGFVRCGNIVRRFDKFLMRLEALDGSSTRRSSSLVNQNFTKFVTNYMMIYHTVLMLESPGITTFTKLLQFVEPLRLQLEFLDKHWWFGEGKSANVSNNSLDLLSRLNCCMLTEVSPFITDLVQNVFVKCVGGYFKYLSDWIFRGTLPQGSHDQFHIMTLKNKSYRDRRFWTKFFVQIEDTVPFFLEELKQLVFETGKVVTLLKFIYGNGIFSSIPLPTEDEYLYPHFTFDGIDRLNSTWEGFMHSFQDNNPQLTSDIKRMIHRNPFVSTGAIEACVSFSKESNVDVVPVLSQHDRKRLKQQELLRQLDQQVLEKKENERKEAARRSVEDSKIEEYITMREMRDAEEEKRIRQKHFGDDTQKRTVRDIFHRLHNEAPFPNSKPSSTSIQVNQNDVVNLEVQGNIDEQGDIVRPQEITGSFWLNHTVPDSRGDFEGAGDAFISQNLEIDPDPYDELGEKFDAEKIQTTPAIPYAIPNFESQPKSFAEAINLPRAVSTCNTADEDVDVNSINFFLTLSVGIPLKIQNAMANTVLLHTFVCEKKLLQHIQVLHNFFALQNGQFGHLLNTLLLQEVNKKGLHCISDVIGRLNKFNTILNEVIAKTVEDEETKDLLSSLSLTVPHESSDDQKIINKTDGLKMSPYTMLNSLNLRYAVGWPLNIILTDHVLQHFEKLFNFQMQLLRAELLLQNMFMNLQSIKTRRRSPQFFQLDIFRTKILHLITSIRSYVNVVVIQDACSNLQTLFQKLNSIDEIYESLVRHIKNITSNCLLGPKAEKVLNLLTSQLLLIETFCNQVDEAMLHSTENKGSIPPADFKSLQEKMKAIDHVGRVFVEVVRKIGQRGYYPKILYFWELFNLSGFYNEKPSQLHTLRLSSRSKIRD